MCEIPSNVVLAEDLAARFDGFSIRSNDLTQLVLRVDRDSAELRQLLGERDEAVKRMIRDVIGRAHAGATVGICGEAPSNHPDFATSWLGCGIELHLAQPGRLRRRRAQRRRGGGSGRRGPPALTAPARA